MLAFALEYKQALVVFTGNLNNNVRRYEFIDNDWDLVGQLSDVLKVRTV